MEAYDPFQDIDSVGGSQSSRARAGGGNFSSVPARSRSRSSSSSRSTGGLEDRKRHPKPGLATIRGNRPIPELIGKVRAVNRPGERRLCSHFLGGDCLWGDRCRFSHDAGELRAGAPATTEMSFSNLESNLVSRVIKVPRPQLKFLMTEGSRQMLANASGLSEVTWEPEASKVTIAGTALQVESAEQLLKRVFTHCNWGVSEAKVQGLLSLRPCKAARVRLSPMAPQLKQTSINLNCSQTRFTMGSDASNDLTLKGPLISRAHLVLEFKPDKGALYVIDVSTNGAFLNGVKLPSKSSGRVVLWHGDELLFPEPNKEVNALEFGFMVNLELL